MSRQPHHAHPLIPTDLSAEQALAVFELLDRLRDEIYEQ